MKNSEIRENARKSLFGKWGKGVLIILAYWAVMFIISIIESLFGKVKLMTSIISIAKIIISIPLAFGVTYSFIKLKRNEEVKAFDFLNSGFSNFERAWKISLRAMLKMILPIILMTISIAAIIIIFAYFTIELYADNITTKMSVLMSIGTIVIIAIDFWYIIRALSYSLITYISFDNPNMTALEVVNESERLMEGNKGKFVLLSLSFIGWAILCLFTLGIGYLWLIPYMQVAIVCFYESVSERNDNNIKEENEPIIEK